MVLRGQTAEMRLALHLMVAARPHKVIADKAYDADWLLHYLDSEGIEAVIPPKKNRLQKRTIDYNNYMINQISMFVKECLSFTKL